MACTRYTHDQQTPNDNMKLLLGCTSCPSCQATDDAGLGQLLVSAIYHAVAIVSLSCSVLHSCGWYVYNSILFGHCSHKAKMIS